ncbi:hypothetical protein IWW36_005093, partial [Coemansia brasiliensis]
YVSIGYVAYVKRTLTANSFTNTTWKRCLSAHFLLKMVHVSMVMNVNFGTLVLIKRRENARGMRVDSVDMEQIAVASMSASLFVRTTSLDFALMAPTAAKNILGLSCPKCMES